MIRHRNKIYFILKIKDLSFKLHFNLIWLCFFPPSLFLSHSQFFQLWITISVLGAMSHWALQACQPSQAGSKVWLSLIPENLNIKCIGVCHWRKRLSLSLEVLSEMIFLPDKQVGSSTALPKFWGRQVRRLLSKGWVTGNYGQSNWLESECRATPSTQTATPHLSPQEKNH